MGFCARTPIAYRLIFHTGCSFKGQKRSNLLSNRNDRRGLERHDRQDHHSF